MVVALLALGLFGLLGMTWLFPLTARAFSSLRSPSSSGSPSQPNHDDLFLSAFRGVLQPLKIAVLVPAHNDETGLSRTLESVSRAARVAREKFPSLTVELHVGLDGCTDNSGIIASMYGARVLQSARNRGKWRTLMDLAAQSEGADWVAFADCGIVWEENFLLQVAPECFQPSVMGLAPTYKSPNGGKLERVLWSVERHFKTLEDQLGGPVSIHGATVLYRKAELMTALDDLKASRWLNDDVVVPLVMRGRFPGKAIRYLSNVSVYDSAPEKGSRQFTRRRRLVLGNVQWMKTLLPSTWRTNAAVGTVALRRVFRVFWAYWLMLLAAAALLYCIELACLFPMIAIPAVATAGTVIGALFLRSAFVRRSVRTVSDSALASLLAPFYLINAKTVDGARWK